jgi:hypothetical protein
MRKGWFVLFFLLVVGLVAYTNERQLFDWSFIGLYATPGYSPEYDPSDITTPVFNAPLSRPNATNTPAPTPYPTYTPYPTLVPIYITNTQIVTSVQIVTTEVPQVIRQDAPKETWQIVADYWFVRCLLGLIVFMLFASMYLWYAQYETTRRAAIDRDRYELELQHKQLDNERVQIEANIPQVRPIITNRNVVRDEPKIKTSRGIEIEKRRVVEFVTESLRHDGIGLVVSKWKNDRKWDQAIVESILDYLSDLEFITPRQNGRACEWLDEYRTEDVLKEIANDQLPLPRESDGLQLSLSSV